MLISCRYQELEHERDGYKDAMMQSYQHVDEKVQAALDEKDKDSASIAGSGGGGFWGGGSNKQTLQELATLKKQMKELKPLEKLRPQILALQQELVEAAKSKTDLQDRLTDDNIQLTEHNEELAKANEAAEEAQEELQKEVEVSKGLVLELTERIKQMEGEGRQLQIELKEARLETEYIKSTSADPSRIAELEAKAKELLSTS